MHDQSEDLKIAIIGCGGMGGALVGGLVGKPVELRVFDRVPDQVTSMLARGETDVRISASASAAADGAHVVVLAVKPHDTGPALQEITGVLGDDTLVISVAAGVTLDALQELAPNAAIARAMPNVGSALQLGTTGVVLGQRCRPDRDRGRVEAVFGAVGALRFLSKEDHLHAVTALCGSGPAFFLLALEALTDAGLESGLKRDDALFFAAGAMRAASGLVDAEPNPAAIRARITSPGGTTIAGLVAAEKSGARVAMHAAVAAAIARSKELSG